MRIQAILKASGAGVLTSEDEPLDEAVSNDEGEGETTE
jgi:hypothetical protein